MKMLKFELKKIRKKGLFLLVPLLALLMVVYGNYGGGFQKEGAKLCDQVGNPSYALDSLLSENPDIEVENIGLETKLIGRSKKMDTDFQALNRQVPKNVHMDDDREFVESEKIPPMSASFIKGVQGFAKKYKLSLAESLKGDLAYERVALSYLEEKRLDKEKFLNEREPSFQDLLLSNFSIYFGLLPLIFFLLLFSLEEVDEYENDHIYFLWTQPWSKKSFFGAKLGSFFILGLFYCLLVLVFQAIISSFKGNLYFLWDFPMKVMTYNQTTMSLLGFLVRSLLIFLLRLFFFLSLGGLFAQVFKRENILAIFEVFFFDLFFCLTKGFDKLKSPLNPAFTDYISFILGREVLEVDSNVSGYLYAYRPPTFKGWHSFCFIVLSLLLNLLALSILSPEKAKTFEVKVKPVRKKMSLLGREQEKQALYLPPPLGKGLLSLLILSQVFVLTFYDGRMREFGVYNNMKVGLIQVEANLIENRIGELAGDTDGESLEALKKYKKKKKKVDALAKESKKLSSYYDQGRGKEYYDLLYRLNLASRESEIGGATTIFLERGDLVNGELTSFSKIVSDDFRKKLLEADIAPLNFDFDRALTRYDKTRDENTLKGMIGGPPSERTGPILLYRLFENMNFAILLILLGTFIFGASYELDSYKGRQVDFIFCQPIERDRYFSIKYRAGLINLAKFLGFSLALVIGLGLILSRKKSLDFPVLRYLGVMEDPFKESEVSSYYDRISLGTYLWESILLIYSGMIFLFSLSQVFSVSFLEKGKSLTALGLLALLFLGLGKIYPNLASYNPFIYLNPPGIVTGDLGVRKNIQGLSLSKGLCIQALLSLFLYLLGRKLSRKNKY